MFRAAKSGRNSYAVLRSWRELLLLPKAGVMAEEGCSGMVWSMSPHIFSLFWEGGRGVTLRCNS